MYGERCGGSGCGRQEDGVDGKRYKNRTLKGEQVAIWKGKEGGGGQVMREESRCTATNGKSVYIGQEEGNRS